MRTTRKAVVTLLLLGVIAACSEGTPTPVKDDVNDDPTGDPAPSRYELVTNAWRIDTATHKGVYDGSSTGKKITFFGNFTYDFNGSLQGTWYFAQDSTHLVIDEGKTYMQDWTIKDLSDERFEVDFKSPFTGGASTWIMHPIP